MWFLALVASVGLHVETVEDVELDEVTRVTEEFASALETQTSSAVVVDSLVFAECAQPDRCVEQIRARTRSADVVLLKFFGGVRSFRLTAERFRADGSRLVERIDLPLQQRPPDAFATLAKKLFPDPTGAPLVIGKPPPIVEPVPSRIGPIALGGVAIGAAIGATVFRVSAVNAANTLEGRATIDEEYDRLSNRTSSHTVVSNVLFTAAAASVIAAVTWWLLD